MRIGELIAGVNARPQDIAVESGREWAQVRICDLTEDSRTVMPGSLFIARRGEKSDGRAFVEQAVSAGAVAVLTDDPSLRLPGQPATGRAHTPAVLLITDDVPLTTARIAERFWGEPSSRLVMLGVTGTNGKTTTTFLIHQILNVLGLRTGLTGTIVIDDGVEVAPAALTTPPALEISRTLARMLEAGCEAAVMEVSSHALHQRRVAALRFDAAVFTNLTGEHLDYHGTMDRYATSKATLFTQLKPVGGAVVNAQDPSWRMMAGAVPAGCPVVRCSIGAGGAGPGAATATVVRQTAAGTDCVFVGDWGSCPVRLPLVGAFNVMNSLEAAAAVFPLLNARGIGMERMAWALEQVTAPPGRLEPITRADSPVAVYVDYAHTDDALRTVLTVLRSSMSVGTPGARGALWCVFGCGGDRDRTKRSRMGTVAAALADRVVITSDNPRTESPRQIIEEILRGVPTTDAARTAVEADRERAIRLAIMNASPGDCVVIAGKGHEDYQLLPDGSGGVRRMEFDDREVARRCAEAKGLPVRPVRSRPDEAAAAELDEPVGASRGGSNTGTGSREAHTP